MKYDVYFENLNLISYISENHMIKDVCVDLYGQKQKYNSRYVLTTKHLNYKVIDSYGMLMTPIELNILYDVKGMDIFLYDLAVRKKNELYNKHYIFSQINYYIKYLSFRESLIYCKRRFRISLAEIWNRMRKE